MLTFYQLLAVEPTATAEEIKKAFRNEIARYHPDKVQHLGKEFQEMAATRAAQLTEAYRTLMNPELRSEYDRLYAETATAAPAAPPPSPFSSVSSAPPTSSAPASPGSGGASSAGQAPPSQQGQEPPPPAGTPGAAPPQRFASERRDRDDFVRRATLGKFRQALAAEVGQFEEVVAKGLDLDCATKAKGLFSRNGGQRFAIKFVARVDRAAVQEAWAAASQKGSGPVCVFLMGNGVASASELGEAIAEMRKKSRSATGISIIPIDVRDWSAHIPNDAPAPCKKVLQRLRDASS